MTRDRFTGPARSPFNVSSEIKWKNTSGGSIPAYGVIKLSGYDAIGDYFNAVKPDGEGNLHFVNGPVAVAANAYGGSQLWNHSRIGKTSSTTFGATVGPVDDSWEMKETGSGFITFSDPSGGVAAILQVGGGGGESPNIMHGIVHASLGCGYYEVEIATWNGVSPSGSGSGSNSGTDGCDICEAIGATTSGSASISDCEEEAELPVFEESEASDHIVERQTTGTGVIVLAFHAGSRFVPLAQWSDCLMVDLGDENDTVSDSDSDSSVATEPVYQILSGHQEHVIQYKEEWGCCNGTWKIISRTPIIFAAKVCAEETCADCD